VNKWNEIIDTLAQLSNPEPVKSLYIKVVQYLSEHPVSKEWYPYLDSYYFFKLAKDSKSQVFLTFESPATENLFFGVVKHPFKGVHDRQSIEKYAKS
jgi:hypothetical protein